MSQVIEVKALQGQVRNLADDLRERYGADTVLRATLRREFDGAKRSERAGITFESWLEDTLDQAAVAWVLGCVFVRFCEDNNLLRPNTDPTGEKHCWLGGPEPHASVEIALQNRQRYLVAHPTDNDRHWLREAFGYLRGLRATGGLFDEHNPVWRFDISGEAAETLSDFFRRGAGNRSLKTATLDTRFLGDLYQDLSAHARSTYALLQTPEYVESFILDRTFEPAVQEFGLAETSVIDPTCGSGHFLLGAFGRLFAQWAAREPNTEPRVLAERALGQVTGVDLNPAAVAIARFRLLVAAMAAAKLSVLERAPAFPLRVAVGDSLLRWGEKSSHQGEFVFEGENGDEFAYYTEDADILAKYLRPGQYTVVVGNPPYITVKDRVLNERYRGAYDACAGKYALTVPFAQRFFELARRGDHDGDGAGWVGQITSNSFMKREFGKKLINVFFRGTVELTEVIDTSGAYIPGHGTPTVVLVGRNRLVSPRYSVPIRTVRGIRGEPELPADPARGLVWNAILRQIDAPGSESEWVSVDDAERAALATHPWSLTGGSAVALMTALTHARQAKLADRADAVGITAVTGEDDLYVLPDAATARRLRISPRIALVEGEVVRDFVIRGPKPVLWPYNRDLDVVPLDETGAAERLFRTYRSAIDQRRRFGTPMVERGLTWWEWQELYRDKLATPLSIAYGEVSTHNHFVLDRGGKVFKQTAPVIKLPEGATEDDHLELLGILNSSAGCFWLKQSCFPKGGSGIGRGIQPEAWMDRYAFNASNVERLPLPAVLPLGRGKALDALAQRLSAVSPRAVVAEGTPTRERLAAARSDWHSIRAQMIALQEELDWEVYRHYGLLAEDLTTDAPPGIALGERTFEIVLAREADAGATTTEWFNRHGSTPITELPAHWPADYRALVQRRLDAIASNRNIALLERPEHKRRWSTEGWDALQGEALRSWLLDRLEGPDLWGGGNPTPLSVAQLADRLRFDHGFRSVLDLWVGSEDHDLVASMRKLIAEEHVPYLAADRYKPSGLRKRAQWERTWDQQRREDAGEDVTVDVPPRYTSADYARHSYARLRGKLDVPRERFISYPRAGRDGDPTELLGWAGWDHLAQARALAGVYLDRKTQGGWPAATLLPLLAGLLELEPWLHQWFADPQPGFPSSPADFITGLIDTELGVLEADRGTLARLRGVPRLS